MATQKWDLIINDNKPTLSYRLYYASDKTSTKYALIVPGYGNHIDIHDEMCNYLSDNNVTTMVINLEGHGTSFGTRFSINSFDDYCDNIKRAILTLKNEFSLNELIDLTLIGHSNGGLISHYFKEKFDINNDVKRLILACPFYGMKNPSTPFNLFISNKYVLSILKFISQDFIVNTGGIEENVCDNPDLTIKLKNDFLSPGYYLNQPGAGLATAAWALAAFDAQNYLLSNAKTTIPILFANVSDDQVIDKQLVKNMYSKLSPNNSNTLIKEFVGKHNLFWCNSRFEIFDSIIEFIKK